MKILNYNELGAALSNEAQGDGRATFKVDSATKDEVVGESTRIKSLLLRFRLGADATMPKVGDVITVNAAEGTIEGIVPAKGKRPADELKPAKKAGAANQGCMGVSAINR